MNIRLKKWFCILMILICAILNSGCKLSFFTDLYPAENTMALMDEGTEATTEESMVKSYDIYVHVCGSVKKPGLYSFSKGERIDAAIKAAGGFSTDADQQSVNLAELLIDGTQIYVACREDLTQDGNSGKSLKNAQGEQKININEADQTELMTLNGIGEGRALAIIAYRQEHGKFSSIEDIKEVSGIGDAIYDKIKNTIMVE